MGDPVANLWTGCLGPVVRNLLLTALTFVVAVVVAVWADSVWAFLGIMFGGATLWWWLERSVFVSRTRRETRARAEFLGLPEDQV